MKDHTSEGLAPKWHRVTLWPFLLRRILAIAWGKCWTSADLMNRVKEAENGRCWPPHSGFKLKNCDLWPAFLFGLEHDWRQRAKETSCPQSRDSVRDCFCHSDRNNMNTPRFYHVPSSYWNPRPAQKEVKSDVRMKWCFPLVGVYSVLFKIQLNGNRRVPAFLLLTCSQRQYLSDVWVCA